MTESLPRLTRATAGGRGAAPVRIVHLGLGSFVRAHLAWYTDRAPDADQWGIAGFTGRSAALARTLTEQQGAYAVVVRAADGPQAHVVRSLSSAHAADEHATWLALLADPTVAILSTTVTEAGYCRGADGRLDLDRADVRSDLARLRADPAAPVGTAPARLVAGLAARRAAGGGPVAVVPLDNLPANGDVVRAVVTDLADALDASLASWVADHVSFVTSMVDRITPATTDADLATAARLLGLDDRAPVPAEPYSEWVVAGSFPAGRPAWDDAGARLVDDVAPYERRKLWLLNGAHSLLAYAGLLRGHVTVADAIADPVLRSWVEAWWDEAGRQLDQEPGSVRDYRAALLGRFANPEIRHLLAQVAMDGSQKLPVRILPTLRAERAAGRLPVGAARVLSAWVAHLRRGSDVRDPALDLPDLAADALPAAVDRCLRRLDAGLADDRELRDAVLALAGELSS